MYDLLNVSPLINITDVHLILIGDKSLSDDENVKIF